MSGQLLPSASPRQVAAFLGPELHHSYGVDATCDHEAGFTRVSAKAPAKCESRSDLTAVKESEEQPHTRTKVPCFIISQIVLLLSGYITGVKAPALSDGSAACDFCGKSSEVKLCS